jgi:hypothetical protein
MNILVAKKLARDELNSSSLKKQTHDKLQDKTKEISLVKIKLEEHNK